MKKIVTIGGGTGSFMLLSGLKKYPLEIGAIVSMADNGGSAGVFGTYPGAHRDVVVGFTGFGMSF